jgi:hypothetical protein
LIKPEPERGLKLMEEKEEESPTTDSNSMWNLSKKTLEPDSV